MKKYDRIIRKSFVGLLYALFIIFFVKSFGAEAEAYVYSMKDAVSDSNVMSRVYTYLMLPENSIKINPGEVETIEGTPTPTVVLDKTIIWESSNTNIVTVVRDNSVFNKAYITGENVGKAEIYAKNAEGTVIATCNVTVGNPTGLKKAQIVKGSSVTMKTLKGQKGSIKIKYKEVTYATGYQIRYKKSGKWLTIDTKKKSYTIKNLKKGKYKIKIRPYKTYEGKKYYGKYTKTYKIKVK